MKWTYCQYSVTALRLEWNLTGRGSSDFTSLCAFRHRTSVSTARKWWSLGRKCPSCSSCRLQMKCAPLLVRTTHTPPALASSPCPYRSLNWVSTCYIYHIVGRKKFKYLTPTAVFHIYMFLYLLAQGVTFSIFSFDSPTVHFNAYCPSFIGQYCRVSALLELESLMSQQALREAFSEAELLAAKKKHQQIQEHMQVRPFMPRTKAACFATTSGLYMVVSVASGFSMVHY